MLFILSDEIQAGKTRWLTKLTEVLRDNGVCVAGVLAPGIWRKTDEITEVGSFFAQDENGIIREKMGIDNILLPEEISIPFARRRDLISSQEAEIKSQSAQANLVWEIPDTSLALVNEHFDYLSQTLLPQMHDKPVFVVIDEIGPLELQQNQGLTSAVNLLKAGLVSNKHHALVIIRPWLVQAAKNSFSQTWDELEVIAPSDESTAKVLAHFF